MSTEHKDALQGADPSSINQTQSERSEKSPQLSIKTNAPRKKHRFRFLKWLLYFIFILLLLLIIAGTALWVWAGKEGSLAQAVSLAQRFVPIVGHALSAENIKGSIRQGGSIGSLRWKQNNVDIQASDITLSWDFSNILQRKIKIEHIVLNQVHLTVTPDTGKKENKTITKPPQKVGIPFITIEAPDIQINNFIYGQEEQGIIVTQTRGNYNYDGRAHHLTVEDLHFANADFKAQISLTGNMPELNAQIQAQKLTFAPMGEQPATIRAIAQAQGPLTQILIQVQANIEESETVEKNALETQKKLPLGENQSSPYKTTSSPLGKNKKEQITEKLVDETVEKPSTTSHTVKTVTSSVNLQATLTPWDISVLPQAELNLQKINLSAFWPTAPQTLLTGTAKVNPLINNSGTPTTGWKVILDIKNQLSGALDENQIPLTELHAQALWENDSAVLQKMQAFIGTGTLQARGRFKLNPINPPNTATDRSKTDLNIQMPPTPKVDKNNTSPALLPYTWQLTAKMDNIDLHDFYSKFDSTSVSGIATAEQNELGVAYYIKINADPQKATHKQGTNNTRLEQLHAQGIWTDKTLNFDRLLVKASNSLLRGKGKIFIPEDVENTTDHIQTDGQFELKAPGIDAEFHITALTATQGFAQAQLQLRDANKTLEWIKKIPVVPKEIQNYTASGSLTSQLQMNHGWRLPQMNASLDSASLFLSQIANDKTPEKVLVQLKDTHITLNGTPQQAQLKAKINALIEQYTTELELESIGENLNQEDIRFKILQLNFKLHQLPIDSKKQKSVFLAGFNLKAPVNIDWNNPVGRLEVGPGSLALKFAQADNKNAPFISWEKSSWQRNGDLISRGKISEFPIQWLTTLTQSRFADINIGGNLMLEGNWHIQMGSKLDFLVEIGRSRGDLEFTQDSSAFAALGKVQTYKTGIKDARLKIYNQGNNVNASFVWDTERASSIDISLMTTLSHQNNTWSIAPNAALSGHAKAKIQRLDILSALAPTGWRMGGNAELNALISGNLSEPSLKGTLHASDLGLRSVLDGIAFSNGQAKLDFDGNRVNLNTFTLKGEGDDGGQVNGQGFVQWSGQTLNAQLKLTLNKFKASANRDRLVILSGTTEMSLRERILNISGSFDIDKALIILANTGAPQLDSDVVILDETHKQEDQDKSHVNVQTATPGITPKLNITLRTGQDFRVQGFGLQTYLRGMLVITNSEFQPRIIGQINTEDGKFRAYGQKLDIQTGQIVFSGPFDNPTLNILAIRPQTQETVGVKVTGTAKHTKVSLYSASGLSDSDTLSWLLLGRPPSAGGAESAALEQAALALLNGDGPGISDTIAKTLGLDEISVGGSSSSSNQGDDSLSGTTITIGKRLSDKFYVSYEQGLSGASSAFFVFYQISKRLTLRAETGENSALDIIYSFRFN